MALVIALRPEPVEVTLLTQADCAFCDQAREILDRLGGEHPLRVRTVDVSSPEGEELVARNGVLFAPGVLIDGRPFSYGRPSERKLRRELARRRP